VPPGCISRRIKINAFWYKGSPDWSGILALPAPASQITEGCGHWIKAPVEPAIKALFCFFPKIANIVGGHDCLDISRSLPPRNSGQRFVDEMHLNTVVNEFTKLSPISKISGRAVDLVHQHAARFWLQESQHLRKYWPSALGGSLSFLEMLNDFKTFLCSITLMASSCCWRETPCSPCLRVGDAGIGIISFVHMYRVNLMING